MRCTNEKDIDIGDVFLGTNLIEMDESDGYRFGDQNNPLVH
jgi:hypothetical protein